MAERPTKTRVRDWATLTRRDLREVERCLRDGNLEGARNAAVLAEASACAVREELDALLCGFRSERGRG